MEVILLERIEKLGQMGDVVKVKDGFARNFLLPQKKALRASEDNLAYFEKERVTLEANNLKQKQEAEVILEKLDNFNLIIIRQAGETGQLYGSVNTNDIKIALDKNGFIVEKNQIKLDKPIKGLGVHNVSIKLHPEVQAMISVIASRTDAEAETLIKGEEISIEKDGNLTEEECDNFGDEIVNNNITPKKWEILCNILSENWAESTGGSVRIYHCNSYEEAKILNDKYHKNLNYNITKWGEFSYILIKWFGDIS